MKPDRDPQPLPQTLPVAGTFSVDGRVGLLELIVHALNESGATGVGALLDYREPANRGRPTRDS